MKNATKLLWWGWIAIVFVAGIILAIAGAGSPIPNVYSNAGLFCFLLVYVELLRRKE